jgi:hypothetical protein
MQGGDWGNFANAGYGLKEGRKISNGDHEAYLDESAKIQVDFRAILGGGAY